jgi:DNA-binding response OmpR family regulator
MRRSTAKTADAEMRFNGLEIDPRQRAVFLGGIPIELTAKEFDLVAYLASNASQVFSRSQLLEHVWGSSAEWQDPATVTVHVRRVRQKLEIDPGNPRWLKTVWGVGYRFEP